MTTHSSFCLPGESQMRSTKQKNLSALSNEISCQEHRKRLEGLRKRDRELKNILRSLHLNISMFGERFQSRFTEKMEEIYEMKLAEVNRPNLLAAHATKTTKFHCDVGRKAQLELAVTRIENLNSAAVALSSLNEKGITVIQSAVDNTSALLNGSITTTTASHPAELSNDCNSNKRKLQEEILALSKRILETSDHLKKGQDELKKFRGLPPDVDSASMILTKKTRILEEMKLKLGK